jgi:hypothetical protein
MHQRQRDGSLRRQEVQLRSSGQTASTANRNRPTRTLPGSEGSPLVSRQGLEQLPQADLIVLCGNRRSRNQYTRGLQEEEVPSGNADEGPVCRRPRVSLKISLQFGASGKGRMPNVFNSAG